MDEVYLEGKHINLDENGKKGDIGMKKIDTANVARKSILLETANLLRQKVMQFVSQTLIVKKNGTQTSFAIEESNQANDVKAATSCAEDLKQERALVTTSNKSINYQVDWIVDSGCSNHMTGDVNKLQ